MEYLSKPRKIENQKERQVIVIDFDKIAIQFGLKTKGNGKKNEKNTPWANSSHGTCGG